MKVTQNVPLLLVEKQALNAAMGGEKHILRRPRIGAGSRVRSEPYKLTRHCEVTAILILYGLPRLLTGTILAHEMMHAWMRLNGYQNLRQDVEEAYARSLPACGWNLKFYPCPMETTLPPHHTRRHQKSW